MKLDDLELGDYRLRFKLIDELNEELVKLLHDIEEDLDEADDCVSDSYGMINVATWSSAWLVDVMYAEGEFLDLLEDISEPQARFIIQKKLKEHIDDVVLPAIDYVLEVEKREDTSNCTYDTRNIIRRYVDALQALKKVYSELY